MKENKYYTFKYGNYTIYILEKYNIFESYIQKDNFGILYSMFDILKKDINVDIYINIVLGNIEKYIKIYEEKFKE